MRIRLKQHYVLLALFTGMLISACENDINKVKAIAAADATKPIQRTTGVDMIFSDSGVVKARLITPLLIQYDFKDSSYQQMPKGVKVLIYNPNLKVDGTVIADTGYNYDKTQIIKFKKNVVATNDEGTTYKSEELIWDRAKKQIYSTKNVLMTKVTGDQMTGTSFTSDDHLKNPVFQNSTAIIHVDDSLTQ
ncbi:LPS export ABC transporter periplasmic protein LptC [Mucilaginibacter litoreus]|uniref:LPS export ABC transporter periplasmic protein LptC n=1 Tax=Mucilaginibacter litoreus TaxID=1048221 RepID=A0ABW3ASD0_9SPHI